MDDGVALLMVVLALLIPLPQLAEVVGDGDGRPLDFTERW